MKQLTQTRWLDNFRIGVLIAFVFYLFLRTGGMFEFLAQLPFFTTVLALAALLCVVWQIWQQKMLSNTKYMLWVIAFLAICVVSILVNAKYGITNNIKTLAYMILQVFFFFNIGTKRERASVEREMNIVGTFLCVMQFLFALPAIFSYLFDIQLMTYGANGTSIPVGYIKAYNRAWGFFYEVNLLATLSLIALVLSVYLLLRTRRKWVKAFHILNIFVQFSVIALTLSRTAMVVMLFVCFLVGWYFYRPQMENFSLRQIIFQKKRWIFWLLGAALTVFGCVYGYEIYKKYFLLLIAAAILVFAILAVFLLCKKKTKIFLTLREHSIRAAAGVSLALVVFGCYAGFQALYPYVRYGVLNMNPTGIQTSVSHFLKSIYEFNDIKIEIVGEPQPESPAEQEEDDPVEFIPLERGDQKKDVTNGRIALWKDGLEIFSKSPIIGTSYRNITAFAQEHAPETKMARQGVTVHSGYLDILVSTGVVGFAVFMAFLFLCARRLFLYRTLPRRSFYPIGLCLCIVAILLITVTLLANVFFYFSIFSMAFWLFLGYGMYFIDQDERFDTQREEVAMFADTPFQVCAAVRLAVSGEVGEQAKTDLFVYQQFADATQITQKLEQSGIFRHVYALERYPAGNALLSKLRTLLRLLLPRWTLRRHSVRHGFLRADYGKLCFACNTIPTMNLQRAFPYGQVVALDDGIGSYTGNIHRDYYSKPVKLFYQFVLGEDMARPAQALYVANPALCRSTMTQDVRALPPVDAATLEKLKTVFSYRPTDDYARHPVVYLTQPLSERRDYRAGSQEKALGALAEAFGDALLVRVHPREARSDYAAYACDEANNLWELECLEAVTDEHILVGAFSTAQFSPKLVAGREPYLVFLYPMMTERWTSAQETVEAFRAFYTHPEKIFVVSSEAELAAVLAQLRQLRG